MCSVVEWLIVYQLGILSLSCSQYSQTICWPRWDDNACLGVRNTSSIGAWPNSLDRRLPWYCISSVKKMFLYSDFVQYKKGTSCLFIYECSKDKSHAFQFGKVLSGQWFCSIVLRFDKHQMYSENKLSLYLWMRLGMKDMLCCLLS